MAEPIPHQVFAETLAQDYVRELRELHPGIVEEWERQRADALASGDPEAEWPDTQSATGIAWWLESEIPIATEYIDSSTDEQYADQEKRLRHFCAAAAHLIRRFLADGVVWVDNTKEIL